MKRLALLAMCMCLLSACDDDKQNPENPTGMEELIAHCKNVDCKDEQCDRTPICKDGERIAAENTEELCKDGYDNDLNGSADCADLNCAQFEYCQNVEAEDTLEKCQDNKDNDKNGKTDCEDPSCAGFEPCRSQRVENTLELCSDEIDNDENGKTDCEDDGCKEFDHCISQIDNKGESSLELCKDGIDNDNDGKTDCADIGCSTFEFCAGTKVNGETTEAECKDGIDNDKDGFIDCAEAACQPFSHCQDQCPEDPFKFTLDDGCPCGETKMSDGTCAINIGSKEDFLAYADNYSRNAVLKLDIDLGKNSSYTPIGTVSNPYKAKFYGNAKRISGELKCKSNTKYCGIFGNADNASFDNIDLAITLSNDTINIENYVGGLLARGKSVRISNIKLPAKVLAKASYSGEDACEAGAVSGALAAMLEGGSNAGNIDATGASSAQSTYKNQVFAGGVVGILDKSTLTKVKVSNSTTAYLGSGNVADNSCKEILAGGVVARAQDSEISDVQFNASVKAYTTGAMDGTITYAHLAGGVTALAIGGKHTKMRGSATIEITPDDSSYYQVVAAGGIIGLITSSAETSNSLDMASFKGSIFAKSLKDGSEVLVGGIVGAATGHSTFRVNVANVESDAKLIAQVYRQRAGGIMAAGFNVDISNAAAKAEFKSYKDAVQNSIGGLVGHAFNVRLVNTYARSSLEIPEDSAKQPIVGALVATADSSHLYESYWSTMIADVKVGLNEDTLEDSTCQEYTIHGEGAAATPVISAWNSALLSKLRQNLGFDGGVASVNIPKGLYLPWIEISSADGKWPSLNFDAPETEWVNLGL